MRLGVAHTIFLEWRTRYFLESSIHRIDRFEPVSRRFAPKSLLKAPVRTTVRIGVTDSPVRATGDQGDIVFLTRTLTSATPPPR